ncbi:Disease resistance response protein [Musa troglodytarum]|nr:Disease resistance response protein [Musa troglodytarum]
MATFNATIVLLSLASVAILAAGKEPTTQLHFYMHDKISNPIATAVRVIEGPQTSSAPGINFGDIYAVDDPLTTGPSPSSPLVGRAQGFSAMASQDPAAVALLLTVNLVFTEGEYKGSTLAILSRDAISPVRELPVVGGSGAFRLARGYVLMKTYSFSQTLGDAILEWDVYVMH